MVRQDIDVLDWSLTSAEVAELDAAQQPADHPCWIPGTGLDIHADPCTATPPALKSDDAKGIDPSLLLFVDRAQLASLDTRLATQTQTPYKGARVISPTEPWETWSILAFHSVV